MHDVSTTRRPRYCDWTVPHNGVLDMSRVDRSLNISFLSDTNVLYCAFKNSVSYQTSNTNPVFMYEPLKVTYENVNKKYSYSWKNRKHNIGHFN